MNNKLQPKGGSMNTVKPRAATTTRRAAPPPPPPVEEDEVQDEVAEAPEDDTQEPEAAEPEQPVQQGSEKKLQAYLDNQAEMLKVDELDLQSEFVTQSQRYFKAAMNYHKAEAKLQQEKNQLDAITATIDTELRASGEKTTEAFIDKTIKGDDRYRAQRDRIVMANLQVGLHQACVRAWEHKKDMLIQTGMIARADMQNGLQLNKTGNEETPAMVNGRRTRL